MKFHLGEIAIIGMHSHQAVEKIVPARYGEIFGLEVEIIALPGDWNCRHCGVIKTLSRYSILMPDGVCVVVPEKVLRKRRPPIPEEVLRQFDVIPVEGEPA